MNKNYQSKSLKPDSALAVVQVEVLLIEDDYSYSELVKILLDDTDQIKCDITVAGTLVQGLEYLKSDKDFDVILLDLTLPDSHGLETLHKLLFDFPDANVIVLTGNKDQKQGIKAVSTGAQDFLVKGEFDPKILARTLRFSMERKQIITLQKKTEELERAQTVAQETARVREQIIANVSHELRTPMNAILGMSNVINRNNFDADQNECIDNIQEASQVLLSIINDILLTSSLQNTKEEIDPTPFDIALTARRISEALMPKANAKGLKLVYQVDKLLPKHLIGDKLKLSQVLYNLIGNAIKFTDNGTVELKVFPESLNESTQWVLFEIHDSGMGVAKDKLKEIFQPFNRIKTPGRRIEGTGLGLTIAQQIVQQMKGELQVSSLVGQGSVFSFTLPFGYIDHLNTSSPSLKDSQIENNENQINSVNLNQVLIVEDHPMNQVVIQRTLEQKWPELEIFMTDTGEKALELLASQKVDLILMDIQLPGLDGYQTTSRIRTELSKLHKNTPILAMTAQPRVGNDNNYRTVGMNDYILKPFDPKTLFDKITQHLNQ